MVKNIAIGTGRRKTATARVFLRDGSGKIVVNGKDAKDYFASEEQLRVLHQPLLVTSNENKFDILINVTGGGLNGQAAACLHGLSGTCVFTVQCDGRIDGRQLEGYRRVFVWYVGDAGFDSRYRIL